MEWYLKVIRDNYANFQGRARRKEYWMFSLFHIIILFCLAIIGGLFVDSYSNLGSVTLILVFIYILATIIPSLAVTVRRLHDINKSGWWYFVSWIPYIGGIWLLVLTVGEGTIGTNQYGPDPKGDYDEINQIGQSIE